MTEICPKELCTGCLACLNSCSHEAIAIQEDIIGFRYPHIDYTKCIDCKLCQKACPVLHVPERRFPKFGYAVQIKDSKELHECASGGASTAFSRYILSLNGIVYGCSGEDIRNVRHIRVDDASHLHSLQGSKYVQSDIGLAYRSVKDDLNSQRQVLFIGTPCQVAGLKSYLHKNYDNLFTADLVCHGVPSQRLLNENIDHYLAKGCKMDERTIRFRDKNNGSRQTQSARIEYGWVWENQPYSARMSHVRYTSDPYMFGFIQGLFFRPSCYKCPYAYAPRVSDFTFSDYWGLGEDSKFILGRGVSSVLLNTEKAASLFEDIKSSVFFEEREVQESIMGNGQLQHPSVRHPQYFQFRELYPSIGLQRAVERCLKRDRLKIGIKKIISIMRQMLKV